MSKFNRPSVAPTAKTPLGSAGEKTTHEGGRAWERDSRTQLYLTAVVNMTGEDTFYEKADARDNRFRELIHKVAVEDYPWLVEFTKFLRGQANMRSASIVVACEGIRARLKANLAPAGRELIPAACLRADEPGEILAYWTSRYGRAIPKPVKRGVADAVRRLYTERNFIKWDSDARGWRFADVLDVCHPTPDPAKPWQGDLFKYILDQRHGHADTVPDRLNTIATNRVFMQVPAEERRGFLLETFGVENLGHAGITWEQIAGWLQGPMDAKAWEAIIPHMGLMALVRNLRNFEQAGISPKAARWVIDRLSNPEEVRKSRQFPYRMLSAYREVVSERYRQALEDALTATCQNVPDFPGRTLVLVDTSASMTGNVSSRSKIRHVDVGALFGVVLAAKGCEVDLFGFANHAFPHNLVKGASALSQIQAFTDKIGIAGHGTATVESIQQTFVPGVHKRVVVISDMQAFQSGYAYGPKGLVSVSDAVPANVPLFGIDTTGYSSSGIHVGTPNRYELGGFNDASFRMMALLSQGEDAGWPWEV